MALSAYDKAVSLLAMREHTEKELRQKLGAKGYSEEETGLAMVLLREKGYLSEERYAEVFCRYRMRKAEGRSVIYMRLLEKGVPSDTASSVLSRLWDEGEWREALMREYSSLKEKKGRDKAVMTLLGKGYSRSEIAQVEVCDE